MPTFVMLTRVSPDALRTPAAMEDLEKCAVSRIEQVCPDVKWLSSYALLGGYDYLDIFTAPDLTAAFKVSAIVRSFGRAHSEVLAATEWNDFKQILHSLPAQ
jgi:uncharacterized protein with GYD domain